MCLIASPRIDNAPLIPLNVEKPRTEKEQQTGKHSAFNSTESGIATETPGWNGEHDVSSIAVLSFPRAKAKGAGGHKTIGAGAGSALASVAASRLRSADPKTHATGSTQLLWYCDRDRLGGRLCSGAKASAPVEEHDSGSGSESDSGWALVSDTTLPMVEPAAVVPGPGSM